jgi:hypothetical protein
MFADVFRSAALAQKVNDTDSIEKLDPLMHGQSHRARLMERIKEQGGQQYGEGYGKNSQAKSENHHPFSPLSSGRGGGIVGTRGRGRQASIFHLDWLHIVAD